MYTNTHNIYRIAVINLFQNVHVCNPKYFFSKFSNFSSYIIYEYIFWLFFYFGVRWSLVAICEHQNNRPYMHFQWLQFQTMESWKRNWTFHSLRRKLWELRGKPISFIARLFHAFGQNTCLYYWGCTWWTFTKALYCHKRRKGDGF